MGRPVVDADDLLLELEALKTLKARYCRYLDAKDWTRWRTLFTDDFVSDTSRAGGLRIAGADDFVAFTRATLGRPSRPTVHQVHAPELEIGTPTTATGVWALQDVVRFGRLATLVGYGHYRESYRKSDAGWQIATSTLTRLREDIHTPVGTLFVSDRMRAAAGRAMARKTRRA